MDANNLSELETYEKIFNDSRADILDRRTAANKIAYICENSLQDGHAAVAWLEKAFELGDGNARFRIAEIYRDGRAMKPSGSDAISRFTKILNDLSLPDSERYAAAFEIAKIFHEGKIVPRSDTAAVKYFALAAGADVVTARMSCNTLAKIYSGSENFTADAEMVLHWLKRAIAAGSNRATWAAAKIFRDGRFGIPQDGEKALEILSVPASREFDIINRVTALRMTAEIFDKGLGVPADKEKAADLYREADSINAEWIHAIHGLQIRDRYLTRGTDYVSKTVQKFPCRTETAVL